MKDKGLDYPRNPRFNANGQWLPRRQWPSSLRWHFHTFFWTTITVTNDNDYTIFCDLHDARTHNGKIWCIYTTRYLIETLTFTLWLFVVDGFWTYGHFLCSICVVVTGIRDSIGKLCCVFRRTVMPNSYISIWTLGLHLPPRPSTIKTGRDGQVEL